MSAVKNHSVNQIMALLIEPFSLAEKGLINS
jgi:hypothetical protein